MNYPFAIDSISRFKSAGEQKETIKLLAKGEIDILIGTHRLSARTSSSPTSGWSSSTRSSASA